MFFEYFKKTHSVLNIAVYTKNLLFYLSFD